MLRGALEQGTLKIGGGSLRIPVPVPSNYSSVALVRHHLVHLTARVSAVGVEDGILGGAANTEETLDSFRAAEDSDSLEAIGAFMMSLSDIDPTPACSCLSASYVFTAVPATVVADR